MKYLILIIILLIETTGYSIIFCNPILTFDKIMSRLIWTESKGRQSAKSHLSGKQQAFTKYQINGYGLEYFNHFNRINDGRQTNYLMADLIKSEIKSKIVAEWILRTAITHFKQSEDDHYLVYAINSYNMGYGNTYNRIYNPGYVNSIIPDHWLKFQNDNKLVWQKGRIAKYEKR